jgi:hypothetical protein
MLTRRAFLAALGSLPLVGRVVPTPPERPARWFNRVSQERDKHEVRSTGNLEEGEGEKDAECCKDKGCHPGKLQGFLHSGELMPGESMPAEEQGDAYNREV